MIKYIIKSKFFLLLAIFIISRFIIYNYFQIKINTPNYGYHLLDITLLENDLFNSLLYLHSQPILWNLFNGIIVKIFSANINFISIFFNIYHCFLSILIIYLAIKIAREFYLSKKVELFISFFIGLNPTIIFYENIFSYAHTTLFFFSLITYSIIKFFKSNNPNYEIYVYLNILILSMIWVLFQPILLLAIFIAMRFFRKISKKNIFIFLLIFIVSLTPMIKNKLIFGIFTASSKSGQDFGTVFYDWEKYCGHPIKDKDYYTKKYFEEYGKTFKHPSLIGEKSNFNNLGVLILGKRCFKITLKRIFDDPYFYIKDRTRTFLASHGKFGFDYVYPNPIGWEKYYDNINFFYKNKKIKLLRQIIVFVSMMYIYYVLLRFIIRKKNQKNLRESLLVSAIIYLYLLLVGTFAAGTEQERILYTGFIIHILFIIIFFNKKIFQKLNNKN